MKCLQFTCKILILFISIIILFVTIDGTLFKFNLLNMLSKFIYSPYCFKYSNYNITLCTLLTTNRITHKMIIEYNNENIKCKLNIALIDIFKVDQCTLWNVTVNNKENFIKKSNEIITFGNEKLNKWKYQVVFNNLTYNSPVNKDNNVDRNICHYNSTDFFMGYNDLWCVTCA